jgi:hypothetical protein
LEARTHSNSNASDFCISRVYLIFQIFIADDVIIFINTHARSSGLLFTIAKPNSDKEKTLFRTNPQSVRVAHMLTLQQ